jgi:nucleoside-diphosphate-sugar epimerase
MRYSPIVPIFGDGQYLQQPIHVDDVAQAVVSCLLNDKAIGKSYNIAGKYPLTYNEVVDTIARQMNKRIWKIHVPSKPVVSLLRFLERIRIPFPHQSRAGPAACSAREQGFFLRGSAKGFWV